ncbi:DUF6415 family natural product biosynthesis protein [Streptomyces sp. NPDC085665]|uniref:DUF6415 family natural product biosynthesis protein n=1 Tax=Streptomyces sp. NPDC085665 TaxID=3365735 RepID=UPI0037D94D10
MTTSTLPALPGCSSSSDTLSWVLQALKLPVESLVLDAICEDINQVADGVVTERESYLLADRLRGHLDRLLKAVSPGADSDPTATEALMAAGRRLLDEGIPHEPSFVPAYLRETARACEDLLEHAAPFAPPIP